MIAELLKEDIPSLSPTDEVKNALDILSQEEIAEVMVCDEGRYLFMMRELDIMSSSGETLDNVSGEKEGHFIYQDDHILKAFKKIQNNDLSVIPVVDKEMKYLGAMRKDNVLDYLSESYSISDKESIVIIEHLARDYSLANISSIIEQEGGKILGVFIAPTENQIERLWISLTIHTNSLQQIISSLERHEYEIVAQMSSEENTTIVKERYESLMTFLNV